ncbi:MAG: radical SAM family heme chaperone HemW [Prolixibacteraceae bacterium]|jgi:oxygen-independent coproporphyrinogen III oxidase|nr:radical SAM family heme chaperone HemW [Prolixibacteraceae bacterium]MBT6766227.1 radical SAM family heme chaperone HemW [Prolixibacteraceae bacterium]MBT7000557.1 radical SAM family heme chaperone HemW [Prolixibacteraceae bacterium]MBT7393505.1 radical SAM family heme chaperone HemW [Prolixibacteraceae bacterium]
MAGIYIHIPFCRQKCFYCDFYKTLDTSLTGNFFSILKVEAVQRKNYLFNEPIDTIYFGGGTPSVLNKYELLQIMAFLHKEFSVLPDAEITFEANPDDLNYSYLKNLYYAGINRLSIGIQSFQNEHLKIMNRRHNVNQAIVSVENAVKAGFENISVDLIYGLPNLTARQWQSNLNQVFNLPVQHLSAYHLTYHRGTTFYDRLKKGTLKELVEKESIKQFKLLIEIASDLGFEQYEISNFAKNKMYSKHNMSYWQGNKYLGLGPSAHSFNGVSRQWNVANLEGYLNAIENNSTYFEEEILTENEKYNEYILTRIRTKWGVSINFIEKEFGTEKVTHFIKNIEKYEKSEFVIRQNRIFTLSPDGLFISDEIMANLMII